MKKIGIIGNLSTNVIGGQIVKTQELLAAIKGRYNDYNYVDVRGTKNPFLLVINIIRLVIKSENIVIILSSVGYFKIHWLVIAVACVCAKPVFEFVVGGTRYEYLRNNKWRCLFEKSVKKIYVESNYMKKKYEEMGFANVEYMPNFKNITTIKSIEEKKEIEPLKLCTFSRIDSLKGVDVAINLVNEMNERNMNVKLDLIGPVASEYMETFKKLLSNVNSNINYVGTVERGDAVQKLKHYDILLCPTKWKTEGFPGAFIDAMAAGLPIIASELDNFKDIIKDGYNGYLIDYIEENKYIEQIAFLDKNRDVLYMMKKNALFEVEKYKTEFVLSMFWKEIE